MDSVQDGDKVVYKGYLTLVQRPYEGTNWDVVVSKDAAIMLYVDERAHKNNNFKKEDR